MRAPLVLAMILVLGCPSTRSAPAVRTDVAGLAAIVRLPVEVAAARYQVRAIGTSSCLSVGPADHQLVAVFELTPGQAVDWPTSSDAPTALDVPWLSADAKRAARIGRRFAADAFYKDSFRSGSITALGHRRYLLRLQTR